MARLPLTNMVDVFALVDRADKTWLRQWTWRLGSKGYAYTTHNGERVHLHVMLMRPRRGVHIDHANRNRLDNRRKNLRRATRSQNLVNATKRDGTQSRFVGVRPSSNGRTWIARVGPGGIHVGVYPTEIAAARARDEAAIRLYRERVTLNVSRTRERSALRKPMVVLPAPRRATRPSTPMRRALGAAAGATNRRAVRSKRTSRSKNQLPQLARETGTEGQKPLCTLTVVTKGHEAR